MGRLLLPGLLGLLVLLTAATGYGLAAHTLLSRRDQPPPALDTLETRAGCTDRLAGIDLQGPIENGSCTIDGTTVHLQSDAVDEPAAVRYAWADYPSCNLENGAGLPASPFRTDDWPRHSQHTR